MISIRRRSAFAFVPFLIAALYLVQFAQAQNNTPPSDRRRPLVLVHYMPWFEADSQSKSWGWHWTMHAVNPDKTANGKEELASHFHPLIGAYDSSDQSVLEYHFLTMKVAGIDGIIIDWYGLQDFRDYKILVSWT